MKVTIRGVNKTLWEQAKHDCITEDKTLGQIVNEGLELRQQLKQENHDHVVEKGRE